MYRRALATAALLLATTASAQQSTKTDVGGPCSQGNNHLDSESWSLVTDCVASAYCSSEGVCEPKRCRKDIFPFGYNDVPYDSLPPLCGDGYFCPDEGDQCLPQIAVGQPCQKDRDDECQPPSNWRDLNGFLNTNGSICLNFTCEWANATVGQECIIDNTAYATYLDSGGVSTFIISRDNCRNGLYCDGTALRCFQDKREGQACTGNKECLSYNCEGNGKCGRAADEPIQAPAYAYALIAVGIVLLMIGTFVTLWFMHKRFRKENQIKLEQYYNEQIAYRQSIMSMSQAKNNLLSADGSRAPYTDDPKGSPLARHPGILPPNMTRESSTWSDADSEILNDQVNHHLPQGQGEGSHQRMHGGVL